MGDHKVARISNEAYEYLKKRAKKERRSLTGTLELILIAVMKKDKI